jgi:hypothetical protein
MKLRKRDIFIIPLLLCVLGVESVFTQENNHVDSILARIESNFAPIQDYVVTADIRVRIPNFRMPGKKIRIYFKQPDKMRLDARGFAMLPKIGVFPSPRNLIPPNAELCYDGTAVLDSLEYQLLKVTLPDSSIMNGNLLLWVNPVRWTIDRISFTASESDYSEIKFTYSQIGQFYLPQSSHLVMDFSQGIPAFSRPSLNSGQDWSKLMQSEAHKPLKGEVQIEFSDFIVNQGLDDQIFGERQK